MAFKAGKLTSDELAYIRAHLNLTDEEIASRLNRSTKIVAKHKIRLQLETGTLSKSNAKEITYDLENRQFWKNVKEQFSQAELETFKENWTKIIFQFKNDVLPTEELQIKDYICLELLCDRILKEKYVIGKQIEQVNTLLECEQMKPTDIEPEQGGQDGSKIMLWTAQIAVLVEGQTARGKEHMSYTDRKRDLAKQLKSTREQRVEKQIANKTFFDLLKNLSDINAKNTEGKMMELFAISTEKSSEKLSEVHEYSDGVADQPFLTPETVMKYED